MADLDTTGAEEIISLKEKLAGADVELWLARPPGDALVTAERAGVISAIGEDNVMATIRLAGQTFRAENPGLDRREGEDAS
jgi:hypothetical protein